MAVSDKVKAMLNLKGKKIMALADYFEMSPQAMRNKLNRGSFSAEDLIRISVFLDAELSFRVSDNQIIVLDANDLRDEDGVDEKSFRKLDKRLNEVRFDKQVRGEYLTNEHGVVVIPPISDADRPDDVSLEVWQKYMHWKFHGQYNERPSEV